MKKSSYSVNTYTKSNGCIAMRVNKEGECVAEFGGFELMRLEKMYEKYSKEVETLTNGAIKLTNYL